MSLGCISLPEFLYGVLIQHDYGNPEGGANLKPALNVLYSLAVAQGAVYGYRTIYDLTARTRLVEDVAQFYSLERNLVSDYLEETVAGCMKDPSFARGRNLVTYAVDLLMESKSRYDFVSGILILGTVLITPQSERSRLLKQLLTGSASFSHVVQRLLEAFGSTSPYSTEIRARAARIVAAVAGSIRLDMMIDTECISSVLDAFEEYSWRPEGYEEELSCSYYGGVVDVAVPRAAEGSDSRSSLQRYRDLLVEGLRVLQKLAANENNCRVISNTEGLLSKAMAPLISDQLHRDHHDEWSSVAAGSLEFMNRFMATLGGRTDDTTKMRGEISSNSQAIIFRTLECHKCDVFLKRQAAQVLFQLSPDTPPSSIMPGGSRSNRIIFIWILLDILLLPDYRFADRVRGSTRLGKKSRDMARLAGEKLQAVMRPSIAEAIDMSMLQSVVGEVIGSLARTVAGTENNAYRIHAAMVLEHLCQHYTKNDENLEELRKAMANVTPEVLREIVHWLTTEEEIQESKNGSKVLLAEEGPDLEQGASSYDNDNRQESSSKGEQHQGIQLQQALIDLCWVAYNKWIIDEDDQDLTRQFNEIAAKICSGQGMPHKTFESLVVKAQDRLWKEKERASSET